MRKVEEKIYKFDELREDVKLKITAKKKMETIIR